MAEFAMPNGASTRPPHPGDSDPDMNEALRRVRDGGTR